MTGLVGNIVCNGCVSKVAICRSGQNGLGRICRNGGRRKAFAGYGYTAVLLAPACRHSTSIRTVPAAYIYAVQGDLVNGIFHTAVCHADSTCALCCQFRPVGIAIGHRHFSSGRLGNVVAGNARSIIQERHRLTINILSGLAGKGHVCGIDSRIPVEGVIGLFRRRQGPRRAAGTPRNLTRSNRIDRIRDGVVNGFVRICPFYGVGVRIAQRHAVFGITSCGLLDFRSRIRNRCGSRTGIFKLERTEISAIATGKQPHIARCGGFRKFCRIRRNVQRLHIGNSAR